MKFQFEYGYCSLATTRHVDLAVVILLLANQVYLTLPYTMRKRMICLSLKVIWETSDDSN